MNAALTPWHRQIAADFARAVPLEAQNDGKLKPFLIRIGKRGEPRVEFACMSESAARAVEQHVDLAEVGERVEALPVSPEQQVEQLRSIGGL